MRRYIVTLSNGSWAEIEHDGPRDKLEKHIRLYRTIQDTKGRVIFTRHIVTLSRAVRR